MENILVYLLKMWCCSAVLYSYYRLALYNERFHQWNRFYLLASMFLSVLIPFLNIQLVESSNNESLSTAVAYLPWNAASKIQEPAFNWQQIAIVVSIATSAILLGKLGMGIIRINKLYKSNQVVGLQNNVRLILTNLKNAPFSFLNWLFWRQDIDPESENGRRILNHELTHINEGHSIDKLVASALVCLFWMNPFFWLIRRELNMLHEFLADRKAIGEQDGAAFAQMILLSVHINPQANNNLVNPFFSSNIKRRLIMITTSKLAKYSYLRRMSGLVVMTISTLALAISIQQVQAQDTKNSKKANPLQKTSTDTTHKNAKKQSTKIGVKPVTVVEHSSKTSGEGKLKGKVAGLTVSADNITQPGGTDPIFIVDGKEVSKAIAKALDGSKIATVNVYKGETATGLYGAKAVNGVVDIKLKKSGDVQADPHKEIVVKGYGSKGADSAQSDNLKEKVVIGYGSKKAMANPYIVVDGKVITEEEMKKIDPSAIESINVLKDKSATEKYGDKGAKGVIEIKLKKL